MRAVKVPKICTLMGSFCLKGKRRKNTEKLCLMTLNSDAKFKEKLTLGSKNDVRNLKNFNASSSKSETLQFDGLLLSKVCNV